MRKNPWILYPVLLFLENIIFVKGSLCACKRLDLGRRQCLLNAHSEPVCLALQKVLVPVRVDCFYKYSAYAINQSVVVVVIFLALCFSATFSNPAVCCEPESQSRNNILWSFIF